VGADFEALRHEGEVVVYGSGAPEIPVPFAPAILKNVLVRFFIVYNLTPEDRARAVADLTRLLEAGALTHNIGARLTLERIAEAHELVEQGRAAGNVVLEVG
jgi:NADPH2:quinone reductase